MKQESPALRSRIMRAVKSRDTTPELAVRRLLHRLGYRFRLHQESLPGKPDIVFPKKRKVVFVHGCFWHGHDCPRGSRRPKANADYWRRKISRNKERDAKVISELKRMGWDALIVWECEIKDPEILARKLAAFLGPPKTSI